MLKLTIADVGVSLQALTQIGTQAIRGNAKLAYNIGKIIKGLKAESDFAREQEANVFRNLGATEKDGRLSFEIGQLSEEQQKEFTKQLEDCYSIEVEIWGNQITVAEIDAAGLSLSPIQFEQLHWLIKDESENESQLNHNG